MAKIAIILHAEPGTHDAPGHGLYALRYTRELHEAGNDVQLMFDGGGTRWIEQIQPDHGLSPLYNSPKQAGLIADVCDYCNEAFDGGREDVTSERLRLVAEYYGHPGIANPVGDGYQIVTL